MPTWPKRTSGPSEDKARQQHVQLMDVSSIKGVDRVEQDEKRFPSCPAHTRTANTTQDVDHTPKPIVSGEDGAALPRPRQSLRPRRNREAVHGRLCADHLPAPPPSAPAVEAGGPRVPTRLVREDGREAPRGTVKPLSLLVVVASHPPPPFALGDDRPKFD